MRVIVMSDSADPAPTSTATTTDRSMIAIVSSRFW